LEIVARPPCKNASADHASGDPALRPEMENLHLRTVGRMRVLVASRYDFGTDSFGDIADDLSRAASWSPDACASGS
jgi:hypothetical protein